MQWDAEDPTHRARHRDAELRGYLRGDLGRFSPFYRRHFKECGVDPIRIRGLSDLGRVRPVAWDQIAEAPEALVVTPTRRDLARHGEKRLVLAMLSAWVTRRLDRVNRTMVEPRYKPLLWTTHDGVPIGNTSTDLELVARAGSRALAVAGLDRTDLVVGLTESASGLPHWQLVLGGREGGVAAVHLGAAADPESVVRAGPTALAGPPDVLLRVLAGASERGLRLDGVRTLLVTGVDPDAALRDALMLASLAVLDAPPAVVASWAPPGVRAQWAECREGAGFHTFPDLEIVEVGRGGGLHSSGPGLLVWSGLGWRGSAFFRLLTGKRAEVVDGTCEACGRRGPMVITGSRSGLGALEILGGRDDVSAFQIELSERDGREELVVFLALARGADLIDVLDDIDVSLDATQYVVLSRPQVESRIRRDGARAVVRS
ncbi:MAG TPA: hypothetical protein VI916_07150 [Acidimicrobiia bacterium]|nr:hypothetical protein [Acidimicrobiia bacterium]